MCHVSNLTKEQMQAFEALDKLAQEDFVRLVERERVRSTPRAVQPFFERFLKLVAKG